MVLIITNENNPATLKLVIAKNFSKHDVSIKIIQANGRLPQDIQHLPHIELKNDEENCIIFIPNAALYYLLPPPVELQEIVNEWLEFEAHLASCLATSLTSSAKCDQNGINLYLKKLESHLQGKTSLTGKSITCCDIAIWSTLYPLYKDKKLSDEYLKEFTNIITWLNKLEVESQFQEALSSYKVEPGLMSYNVLLEGGKYFKSTSSIKTAPITTPQVEAVTEEELIAAKSSFTKDSSVLPKLKKQNGVVLPVPGEKNVLISSALPYVNNVPHLGNIIGCVLSADVFARFSRLCNNNTLYIGGTDEYGTATETKALEEGLSCQAICDKYYAIHTEIYKWFNISFDTFGRSSTPEQTELCQAMFLKLNDNGFMFTQSVEQLHCEHCDRYLADRFVEGGCPNIGCTYEDARGDQCDGCGKLVNAIELKNPRCKICGNTPKLKTSKQFFIDLPKLEPLIHHWIKLSSPGWSHNAQVIAKTWLREGLKPRCITRDLKWGVPVPLDGYRNKVFYVWFDAPIGYISITKAYTKDYEKWWRPQKGTDVTMYQFMAKDNVPFHSILFPSMLLGANMGYVTVSHIMATEYLNYEDGKFSKSRGVGVFGTDARDTGIPSDVWRFYLLYVRPESQDSSFSWADLATKNNSELLNNLGNFVNRALVFAKNNFNNTVPNIEPIEDDYTLLALCTREYKNYVASLEKARLRDGIRHILAISRHGNQYLQMNQPWVLLKRSDEEKVRAGTVIGICCNLACLLAMLLQPYMPDTSASLKKQLNINDFVINESNPEIIQYVKHGHKLGEPFPLFTKLESEHIEELKKRFGGKQNGLKVPQAVDVKAVEAEVAKQADKVRALKSSGATKTVWQPEVAILLDLKKKLELAQKSVQSVENLSQCNNVQNVNQNGVGDKMDIKQLEDDVAKQAGIVRKLKEGGAEKSVWQPEVEKLLALKQKLSVSTGVQLPKSGKSKKK